MMLNIKFKHSYLISILTSFVILCYFAYKGMIAYLIHKELYGSGVDVVITLRGIISLIMLFFIGLQIQFLKIKDLKSQKKILTGIFVVWTSIFFSTIIVSREEILFLIITFLTSVLMLLSLFSLRKQIKEERNTLTEKEIYLLQQLAKKK
tara:strand:- start:557 stop:1006 length:450 start_codon:yes stop_codon:yes gene_type:complete